MLERWAGTLVFTLLHQEDGVSPIVPGDASTWPMQTKQAWVLLMVTLQEVLFFIIMTVGNSVTSPNTHIPRRGRHLDSFSWKDISFIVFNKVSVALMTYHFLRFLWIHEEVLWDVDAATAVNTIAVIPLYFLCYDSVYTFFHKALHVPSLYKYVHKHHHQQMAPSRGNPDAVNVHPFEFVSGEYLHIACVWAVSTWVMPVHVISVLLFMLCAGMGATLNHTRFDLRIGSIYQVRYHDIHHWYPTSNYGQYTMVFDRLIGSYKPYPKDARAKGGKAL